TIKRSARGASPREKKRIHPPQTPKTGPPRRWALAPLAYRVGGTADALVSRDDAERGTHWWSGPRGRARVRRGRDRARSARRTLPQRAGRRRRSSGMDERIRHRVLRRRYSQGRVARRRVARERGRRAA